MSNQSELNSKIYRCQVVHARTEPVEHNFSYPYYLYGFDLDELESLSNQHLWFGYNRTKLVSIFDRDYLSDSRSESARLPNFKERIRQELDKFGHKQQFNRVVLVTGARYFNYVFNPVSFYFCYGERQQLTYMIVEINNTFDERHLYIIPVYAAKRDMKSFYHYQEARSFHVSPFNDMSGEYSFTFKDIEDGLDIRINIVKSGKTVFNSRLWGDSVSFSTKTFLSTLIRYPFAALLAMPRILWQAGKLHYIRKLPVYKKPHPMNDHTIKMARPKFKEKIAILLIEKVLSNIKKGSLIIEFPNGEKRPYTGNTAGTVATINLKNYKLFLKIVFSGLVGVGESYTAGDWDSPNLADVIKVFLENREVFRSSLSRGALAPISMVNRSINRIRHLLNPNNIKGSRRNIHAHYDLSNEFFSLFLDKTLSYSCALFESGEETLEEAQQRKINSIISKAMIQEESKVLEIGSGWGTLALEVASRFRSQVTSITLSEKQYELASIRAKEAKLSEMVQFKLQDYRVVQGSYDRIISVEMLEAVGHEYLSEFFKACDRLLASDGIAVLQVITFPDHLYEEYRKSCDWIQRYIFPGCCIPSVSALADAISSSSNLIIESCENIGPHYGITLSRWRDKLIENYQKINSQGFSDDFIRTWEYYFAYCQAAFESRFLGVHQIVLTRPQNEFLIRSDQQARKERVTPLLKLSA